MSLERLELGRDFNQPLNELPQSLKYIFLKTGPKYQHPLDALPQSLAKLVIHRTTLTHHLDILPPKLSTLQLHIREFSHGLSKLPPNLQILIVHDDSAFEYSIDHLPQALVELAINSTWRGSFGNLLPNLAFFDFVGDVSVACLPPKLKEIVFGHDFNQPVVNNLPAMSKSLHTIEFSSERKQIPDLMRDK